MSQDEIATKLAAARTRLILEKPFLGSLVMHLPLTPVKADWCKTTATDARAFYFNPDYIGRLNLAQTQFILAHEALHCALSHFARRNHRLKHRWDVACDYAVNMMLMDDGLKSPENALHNAVYRGLSAEEIYPLLEESPPEETLDQHLFDHDSDLDQGERPDQNQSSGEGEGESAQGKGQGGNGERHEQEIDPEGSVSQRKPPPSLSDQEDLAGQWRKRLASAAQSARQAGKLSQSWMRMIDDLIQPQLPWRALLARYMMNAARDDYSFQRPSRREGEAVLPSLHSGSVRLLLALDTSGSVTDEELKAFLGEVDALKAQVRASVTLLACDDKLAEGAPWHYEMWQPLALPEGLSGGGGTDFRPVFEWAEEERVSPDLLIFFTDAEGEFPSKPPAYPVYWLVKGKGQVPWGTRIQLN
jgi:predicted metal-dependent peptidase